jgi:hypothetical protein
MCVAPGLIQILLTLYDDDGFIAINKNRIECGHKIPVYVVETETEPAILIKGAKQI